VTAPEQATGLTGVQVGDEVVIRDPNFPERRGHRVTAIGRKYATIDGDRYSLETGARADRWGGTIAYTLAQWARRGAEAALLDLMLRVRYDIDPDMLSDEAIHEITATLQSALARAGAK
jgi:hypothetical protein